MGDSPRSPRGLDSDLSSLEDSIRDYRASLKRQKIFARLTSVNYASGVYAWSELAHDTDGTAYIKPGGLSGTFASNPCFGLNVTNDVVCPVDTFIYAAGHVTSLGGQTWEADLACRCSLETGSVGSCNNDCCVPTQTLCVHLKQYAYNLSMNELWYKEVYLDVIRHDNIGEFCCRYTSQGQSYIPYVSGGVTDLTGVPASYGSIIVYCPTKLLNNHVGQCYMNLQQINGDVMYWTSNYSGSSKVYLGPFYWPSQALYMSSCSPYYAYDDYTSVWNDGSGSQIGYLRWTATVVEGNCGTVSGLSGASGSTPFSGGGSSPNGSGCSCSFIAGQSYKIINNAVCSCFSGLTMYVSDGYGSGVLGGVGLICGYWTTFDVYCDNGTYRLVISITFLGSAYIVFSALASSTTCGPPTTITFTGTLSHPDCDPETATFTLSTP